MVGLVYMYGALPYVFCFVCRVWLSIGQLQMSTVVPRDAEVVSPRQGKHEKFVGRCLMCTCCSPLVVSNVPRKHKFDCHSCSSVILTGAGKSTITDTTLLLSNRADQFVRLLVVRCVTLL